MTASARPSKGWRSRVIVTESGKSRRWVVCRHFLRCGRPRVVDPFCRASGRRPPRDPVDPQMAEGWGVMEDGEVTRPEVGTPQGGVASPLLANIYLHYVFDLWAERWRRHHAQGNVILVRYADDSVPRTH